MKELEKLKMDDEYITQNDIVKRYLHNKLTPEETVEFEEYMLDKPELLEQLELDTVLVETLPKIDWSESQIAEEEHNPTPSIWQLIFGTRLKASLATGLASAFFVTLIIKMTVSTAPQTGNIELFYLSDVRGSENFEQKFSVAQTANTLIFVLEAEFKEATPYIVSLVNTDNGLAVPLSDSYLPSEVGEVYIAIPTQKLPKGSYLFEYHRASSKSETRSSQFVID